MKFDANILVAEYSTEIAMHRRKLAEPHLKLAQKGFSCMITIKASRYMRVHQAKV